MVLFGGNVDTEPSDDFLLCLGAFDNISVNKLAVAPSFHVFRIFLLKNNIQ